MHPRTAARSVLLIAGIAFIVLIVFGTVGLVRSWAEISGTELSALHKSGVTVLALTLAVILLGQVAKLISGNWWLPKMSREELNSITNLISILHPARLVLVDSNAAFEDIETCLERTCKVVEETCKTAEERRTMGVKLVEILKADYPCYQSHVTLAIANSALSRSWLPQAEGSLRTIVRESEPSALFNIGDLLRCENDVNAGVAFLKYRNLLRGLLPPQAFEKLPNPSTHKRNLLPKRTPKATFNKKSIEWSLKLYTEQLTECPA